MCLYMLARSLPALLEGNWMQFWESGCHRTGYEVGIIGKRFVGGCP
jgi:hypothetical protein